MSNCVDKSPKIVAKELFLKVQEEESYFFHRFFEANCPEDGITKEEDYMKELKSEYLKLKIEEVIRLLSKSIILKK